ncbi:hypothetical protein DL93DRAFT_2102549 [Clavulina sp. PMI_390]|nr:hypothetical protein DL93DRAFT_2102549 [Clavulina sp. PMI_390]
MAEPAAEVKPSLSVRPFGSNCAADPCVSDEAVDQGGPCFGSGALGWNVGPTVQKQLGIVHRSLAVTCEFMFAFTGFWPWLDSLRISRVAVASKKLVAGQGSAQMEVVMLCFEVEEDIAGAWGFTVPKNIKRANGHVLDAFARFKGGFMVIGADQHACWNQSRVRVVTPNMAGGSESLFQQFSPLALQPSYLVLLRHSVHIRSPRVDMIWRSSLPPSC